MEYFESDDRSFAAAIQQYCRVDYKNIRAIFEILQVADAAAGGETKKTTGSRHAKLIVS